MGGYRSIIGGDAPQMHRNETVVILRVENESRENLVSLSLPVFLSFSLAEWFFLFYSYISAGLRAEKYIGSAFNESTKSINRNKI